MDVLTFETCWAVNSEIIKQVTSSWSIFIQYPLSFNPGENPGTGSRSGLDCCTEDNVSPVGVRTRECWAHIYLRFTFQVLEYLTSKEAILSALKYVLAITRVLSAEILLFIYSDSPVYLNKWTKIPATGSKERKKVNRQIEIPVNFKRFCYSVSFCHCRQPLIFGRAYQTVPVAKVRYSTFVTNFLIVIIFIICVQYVRIAQGPLAFCWCHLCTVVFLPWKMSRFKPL